MMKKRQLAFRVLLLVLAAAVAGQVIAQAQTGGGYDLTWNVVSSGYMTSMGGSYSLAGTAGQAGTGPLNGGGYTLNGGLWYNPLVHGTYLPLITKS